MQILREKKFYIGMLVLVLTGLLLFVGVRKYFFAPGDLSAVSFEWLAEPQYRLATNFSSGVAWVKVKDKVWRQIDTQGNVLIDNYQADRVSRYDKETGLASFTSTNYNNGFNEGFINLSGEVVISPEYSTAFGFEHGMAPVAKKVDGKYRYGTIDRRGREVLPLVYEGIRPLSPHIFAVEKTGRKEGDPYNGAKWMYINEKGEPISDRIFEFKDMDGNPQTSATTFHTTLPPNLCLAGVDGKVGLINDKGQWVLPASYDMIYGAKREPIGVLKNGKVGFIDLKGNTMIDFQFGEWNISYFGRTYYNQFFDGLAVVVLPGSTPKMGGIPQSGVINEKGELLFTLPGYAMGGYCEGFILVKRTSDKVYGLVDHKGNWYPLPPYLEIVSDVLSEGILRVTVQENAGKYKKEMDGYIKVKINQNQ